MRNYFLQFEAAGGGGEKAGPGMSLGTAQAFQAQVQANFKAQMDALAKGGMGMRPPGMPGARLRPRPPPPLPG